MVPWPTAGRHVGLQPSALWWKLSEELCVASVVVVYHPDSKMYARRTLMAASILMVYCFPSLEAKCA